MRSGLTMLTMALLVLVGCGPSGLTEGNPDATQRSGSVKRVTLAFPRELDLRHNETQDRHIVRPLVNPGLSVVDDQGIRRPALAETVPTLENGLWKTFPDGRMELTWRIRAGARWHDGMAFTTDDLLFTAAVGRDRDVPTLSNPIYASVEEITALDERTILITWKEPHIFADQLFSETSTLPLPRHKLEGQYLESKEDFPRLTFWIHDYLGTGPFRVRSWDPSSTAVLDANPDYVLGRPRLDEIELRFIPDSNTLTASVLSGAIDMAFSLGSSDRALAVRDGWRDGQVTFRFDGSTWIVLFPQLLNPRPAVIAELPFRRALFHAIDRQAMVDTLQGGVAPVAHSFLSPGQAEYRQIEAQLPRYEYDPRRATQMIEALGYTRGADGALRDQSGQRLEVEIRTSPLDQAFNPGAAIADYWQRIGVGATAVRQTGRLGQDQEAQATFPGFNIINNPHGVPGLGRLHSANVPLPENGFQIGGSANRSRYMNAELDGLIDGYFRTIPVADRVAVMGRIARHVAEQLPVMGIYYNPAPDALGNRLVNIGTARALGSVPSWNAHEWDVRL